MNRHVPLQLSVIMRSVFNDKYIFSKNQQNETAIHQYKLTNKIDFVV